MSTWCKSKESGHDMGLGTWNGRSLYKAGSFMTVSKEISKYKLDLVGVQKVRWNRGGTEPTGEYTFFYGKGTENRELDNGLFVHKRIVSAVEGRVSDKMSYIILRGCSCDIIVRSVDAPAEDKVVDMEDSFYEELKRVFDKFTKYSMKILLGDFSANVSREDIFKRTIANESLHKNVTVKSKIFPRHNIHKFTWTSPDGKTHNQIGDSIKVYLMSDHSGQQIVMLCTVWWWQKLGRDWQRVNNTQVSYGEVQSQEIKRGER
jgi:hypothetical protein